MTRAYLWGQGRLAGAFIAGLVGSLAWAGSLDVQVVEPDGRPLRDAVVQLLSPGAAKAVRPMPMQGIVQRNKAFEPSVTVVTVGTQVNFPNEDTVRHHVYSFSPAKRFELKLYSGVPANPVVFDKPGLVVLGCNIHDHMVAWVQVVETPHHGKTDEQGRVSLSTVPDGPYRLQVWHPRLPVQASGVQQNVQVTPQRQDVKVTLSGLLPP